ncbi:MAG: ATP-binding protein, partial [Deltaproteobacteria bacterium]
LFLNAGHVMPNGGRLEVRCQSPTPDLAEITISDTGSGIDAEDINRVFDPFFTTSDFGTGLGLAVVHRIVEGHHGRIEVKSKKGDGTSFKITLPSLKSPLPVGGTGFQPVKTGKMPIPLERVKGEG